MSGIDHHKCGAWNILVALYYPEHETRRLAAVACRDKDGMYYLRQSAPEKTLGPFKEGAKLIAAAKFRYGTQIRARVIVNGDQEAQLGDLAEQLHLAGLLG